ncbi:MULTISPECIES: type II toxin-antitoxin system prevent-host-death family antitoxin [unclassified Frankia]|uniref:type II toxin-antitoxin system Phd/YefM family antitoxin n=1 Tax=unclassified Frankia TaxID=2632575 RepID=UPI002AD56A1A|nr:MULTISPECIES: type II toxin-antitoxin system prevent-host-death family antitoxin [unclassified Frankia]
MSDMTAGQASINARDLSRRAASVLDRVERGERLIVTRDGEPIAEIIPIARTQRLLARWVRDGLIPEPPPAGYATATAVASAARDLPSVPAGRTATDVLLDMREDER